METQAWSLDPPVLLKEMVVVPPFKYFSWLTSLSSHWITTAYITLHEVPAPVRGHWRVKQRLYRTLSQTKEKGGRKD